MVRGDEVVIDPGGPDQEFATISAFGSLIFATGMTKPHHTGEIIADLAAATPVSETGTPTPTGTLPKTGADSGWIARLGLGFLELGAILVVTGRRRRRRARV